MRSDLTVLYVMSHGWSGSTILGNVLGELDGFAHAGELRTLWRDGLLGHGVCGCRRRPAECELWSAVVPRALAGGGGDLAPEGVAELHREASRVRAAPRLLRYRPGEVAPGPVGGYVAVLDRLYRALAEETGARVIVDTSKRAGDAALVRLVPGLTVRYVHLVRDPRAVAYSWWKRDAPGHGPVNTSRDWVAFNLLFEAIRARHGGGGSIRVRHEDFVADPSGSLRAMAGLVGRSPGRLPVEGERTVALGTHHTMLGNPVRFQQGRVTLHLDDLWREDLPAAHRRTVTALTLPLLGRYGYPVRV